jgi:hypothetical protein
MSYPTHVIRDPRVIAAADAIDRAGDKPELENAWFSGADQFADDTHACRYLRSLYSAKLRQFAIREKTLAHARTS